MSLQAELDYWQRKLRLMDWNIRLIEADDTLFEDANGSCLCDVQSKDAVIKVNVNGIDSYRAESVDDEHTLVHELLEIHFAPFKVSKDDDEDKHNAQECAINMISEALVKEKRCSER